MAGEAADSICVRKRIGIAALAIIAVGVLAFMVSDPKKGSVEWHKNRCVHLWGEMCRSSLRWKIKGWCRKVTGKALIRLTREEMEAQAKELDRSRNDLLEAGFLICREYVFTNVPSPELVEILRPQINQWRKSTPRNRMVFTRIETYASGGAARVRVIAPREDLIQWDRILGPTNLQAREVSASEYRSPYD